MSPPVLDPAAADALQHKWRRLVSLALATACSMSLWFSATTVHRVLQQRWEIPDHQVAWLTIAVQLGFVAGALTLAAGNVADRFSPRLVFLAGSWLGAIVNGIIVLAPVGWEGALLCRALTGVCCAAIYPVGMKIMATWTQRDRGMGLGLLVGALVIGSASPHLLAASGGVSNATFVVLGASSLALLGGGLVAFTGHQGPYRKPAAPLQWRRMGAAWQDRNLRRANLGYLGHMWELYAVWAWLPVFLMASLQEWDASDSVAPEQLARWSAGLAFVAIAAGGFSSFAAGLLADRVGRTPVAIASLFVSGICCLMIGFTFGSSPWIVGPLAIVWGAAVISDSAQFSSCTSELADGQYVGTQLTMQTALGFLLTTSSLQLIPLTSSAWGWRWAFVPLAAGPVIGIYAMWRLRQSSARARLAGGKG